MKLLAKRTSASLTVGLTPGIGRSGRRRQDLTSRRRHTQTVGRMDRGVARDPQPGRDDYQGITMNCQDHLYRNLHPRQITRRWFFEQCGVGLGAARWAT